MADFNKPTLTDTYTSWQTTLTANIAAAVKWLDPASAGTLTNVPVGAYRINAGVVETYSGTAWGPATLKATQLTTPRTIALGGLLGGSASFDGTSNVTITATMADGALSIAKTSGLQTSLDAKLPLTGGTLTGALYVARASAADSLSDIEARNGTHRLNLAARFTSGALNPIVAADDKTLIFHNGTVGTGALSIAPWSNTRCGFRINGNASQINSFSDFYFKNTAGTTVGSILSTGVLDVTGSFTVAGTDVRSATRVLTYSGASATPTTAYDMMAITATGALTINAPTGTPVNGQGLVLRIADNGTARTIAFNAAYVAAVGASLPTTTVVGKYLYVACVYNSTAAKWDVV